MHIHVPPGQSAVVTVMMRAAQLASKSLARDFEELEHLQVSARGTEKFVQAAKQKCAEALKAALMKARPGYGLLMEDMPEMRSQDGIHRWIVAPLGGAHNFGHGIPHFAVSIALEKNDELVAGLVLDVVHQRCYFAEKGTGCFVNGQRLRVSGRRDLEHAMLCSNFHMAGTIEQRQVLVSRYLHTALQVAARASACRMLGAVSLDLAYVAAGKCDGLWLDTCHPWDIAAGIVLIKEAGGYATPLRGHNATCLPANLVAGNPSIHKALSDLFQPAAPAPHSTPTHTSI